MRLCPPWKIKEKKFHLLTFLESQFGFKIFVKKENLKRKLEDLELTTLIYNIKDKFDEKLEKKIDENFQTKVKEFGEEVSFEKA